MRPTPLMAVLAATVSSASALLADDIACHSRLFVDEIAQHADCGALEAVTHCVTSDIDLSSSHRVEACFVAAGCSSEEASIAALWLAYECDLGLPRARADDEARSDLRRRQAAAADKETATQTKEPADTTDKAATKPAANPTASPATPTPAPAANTADTKTAETKAAETKAATTDNTATATPADTASSSSPTPTPASASAAAADNPAGTTIECSTTKMVTTKICIYPSGTKTCSTKVTPSSRCAPGIVCQKDNAGNPICMREDNSLTTSGLVVALIFGIGIAAFLLTVVYVCCKDRRAFKRAEAIRRNALGVYKPEAESNHGGLSAVAGAFGPAAAAGKLSKARGSEAHLPLMKSSERDLGRETTAAANEMAYSRDQSPAPGATAMREADTGYNRI